MMNAVAVAAVFLYIAYRLMDRLLRMARVDKFDSRYVFITGCDSGFGQATCKRLDRMGYNVFAGCLTEKGEDELKKTCSDRLVTLSLDVTDHSSITEALATVKDRLPSGKGLWGLINNAGIGGMFGPVEWHTKAAYEQVFNVNLHGLIDMTVTFLPLLKMDKGRLVNVASVVGRISVPGFGPYNCSKYGVECFSDCIRRELRHFGVTVHIIEPGMHRTNLTDANTITHSFEKSWDALPLDIKEQYGREYLDESVKFLKRNLSSAAVSDDISPVVDALTHAVSGMFPRARYTVGMDAKLFWIPLSWCPAWLSDFILDVVSWKKPLPACLKK